MEAALRDYVPVKVDVDKAVGQAVEEQEAYRQYRLGRVEIMKGYAEVGDGFSAGGIAGLGMYALKLFYDTDESREGVAALKDKRKPDFRKYAK